MGFSSQVDLHIGVVITILDLEPWRIENKIDDHGDWEDEAEYRLTEEMLVAKANVYITRLKNTGNFEVKEQAKFMVRATSSILSSEFHGYGHCATSSSVISVNKLMLSEKDRREIDKFLVHLKLDPLEFSEQFILQHING